MYPGVALGIFGSGCPFGSSIEVSRIVGIPGILDASPAKILPGCASIPASCVSPLCAPCCASCCASALNTLGAAVDKVDPKPSAAPTPAPRKAPWVSAVEPTAPSSAVAIGAAAFSAVPDIVGTIADFAALAAPAPTPPNPAVAAPPAPVISPVNNDFLKLLPTAMLVPKARPPPSAAAPSNDIPPVNGAASIARPPTIEGRKSFRKPASGNPVSGFTVREPPFAIASFCNAPISPGDICTNPVSPSLPWDCMCLAKWCRLIMALSLSFLRMYSELWYGGYKLQCCYNSGRLWSRGSRPSSYSCNTYS